MSTSTPGDEKWGEVMGGREECKGRGKGREGNRREGTGRGGKEREGLWGKRRKGGRAGREEKEEKAGRVLKAGNPLLHHQPLCDATP